MTSLRAFTGLLATAMLLAGCSSSPVRPEEDARFGAEWDTAQRYGAGAAEAGRIAGLEASTTREYASYDRLVFSFEGDLPGFRVRYRDGSEEILVVTLRGVRDDGGGDATPQLPAIAEFRRAPAVDGMSRTTVTLSKRGLPFRVGLDVGVFYVDVAHPGVTTSEH